MEKQDSLQDGQDTPQRDNNGQLLPGAKINPEGIGGFQDHPELINQKGRPPKGWTWKEVLEDIANQIAPMEVDGKMITFREAVGNRLWLEAMNGNVAAMKELFTRMEGLPRIDMNIRGQIDTKIPELVVTLKKIIQDDDEEEENTSD